MGSNTDITADNFTKSSLRYGLTPHGKDTQVFEYFQYQTDDGGKTTVCLSDQVEMHFALSKKEVGHIKALKLRGFFNRKCKH